MSTQKKRTAYRPPARLVAAFRRYRAEIELPANRRPVSPGEILLNDFIKPMSLTRTAFADRLGISARRLSGIIRGQRVTAEIAVRLAHVLETTPQLWLNLQNSVDLSDAVDRLARDARLGRALLADIEACKVRERAYAGAFATALKRLDPARRLRKLRRSKT
ncbi:MAG: HigA family addiction module antitoxin [Myxococcales bacterium]